MHLMSIRPVSHAMLGRVDMNTVRVSSPWLSLCRMRLSSAPILTKICPRKC